MSEANKSKQDLEQSYNKLNGQYQALLQKNQNDLIKIKQKQKTFNQTIETMKKQRQAGQKAYVDKIKLLQTNLDKLRATQQQNDKKYKQKKEEDENIQYLKVQLQLQNIKKESSLLQEIVQQKTQRMEHLEQNLKKINADNLKLQRQCQMHREQTVKQLKHSEQMINEKNRQNAALQVFQNSKKLSKTTNSQSSQQTNMQIVSMKQHKQQIQNLNNEIETLTKNNKQKQQISEQLKTRIRETNQQLKRYMDRDRRNQAIVKKKTEQLESIQDQMENMRKSTKTQRKRMTTETSCAKCKQWEQENKLLKQMIKSVQTMVRVREMEAQRYKNRDNLNNSKIHDKSQLNEAKRNKNQLPPLGKRN